MVENFLNVRKKPHHSTNPINLQRVFMERE
jgi:hypothetical protein